MTYFGDFENSNYDTVAEKMKMLLSKVTFDETQFIITQLKNENKLIKHFGSLALKLLFEIPICLNETLKQELISTEGQQLLNFLCNIVFDDSLEDVTKTQLACALCNLIK